MLLVICVMVVDKLCIIFIKFCFMALSTFYKQLIYRLYTANPLKPVLKTPSLDQYYGRLVLMIQFRHRHA